LPAFILFFDFYFEKNMIFLGKNPELGYDTYNQVKKKSYCIFIQQRKLQKIYILACILALITSLLKSQELDQYFQKNKICCFVLMSRITNLYVKCIPDIKKIVLL
jgi:hypothetical protein